MCYHYQEPAKIQFKGVAQQQAARRLNGFDHPDTLIFTHQNNGFETARWGLLPSFARDASAAAHTLNARVETLSTKPSFREVLHQRCLVFADGFYEWQWRNPAGTIKKQYYITAIDQAPLIFAGLFAHWTHPISAQSITTFTIVTTAADTFMAEIHNTKKRMPIMLPPQAADQWLLGQDQLSFRDISIPLSATTIEDTSAPELW